MEGRMASAADHRSFYAALITGAAGVVDPRIATAFRSVAREDFLGPGPWQVKAGNGYIQTPSDDPAFLYQNILVALSAERGINNGEPLLHARCLSAVSPQAGDRVVQIGTGTGYYTAILAELVGPRGRVVAFEIDTALAERARRNLSDRPNVELRESSGVTGPLPEGDVIYVSAGATRPVTAWLEALAPGGRLIFPLTPEVGLGAMLRLERKSGGFAAEFISTAQFIGCIGGRDEAIAKELETAFAEGGARRVRSLHLAPERPDESCWFVGEGWWLSTKTVN